MRSIFIHGGTKVMRIISRAIITSTGVVGLIGSAFAADMTGPEIKTFLSGKTAYLETTAASSSGVAGKAVIYWAADGSAIFKTANGSIMHGKWNGRSRVIQIVPIGRRDQAPGACAMTRTEMS
jgi:hypothetical protein